MGDRWRSTLWWLLFAAPGLGAVALGATLVLACDGPWRWIGAAYVATGIGAAWVGRRLLWSIGEAPDDRPTPSGDGDEW